MSNQRKVLHDEILKTAEKIQKLTSPLSTKNIPIKRSSWTIDTALAHLVISQKLSKDILQGDKNPYKNADPEIVAATNSQLLNEFKVRNYKLLGTMFIANTKDFLQATKGIQDDYVIQTHYGKMSLLTCLSYNLCHLLIHGSQISLALKKQLVFKEKHFPMILPFLKQAMLVTFDKKAAKSFSGSYTIHLQNSIEFSIVIKKGKLEIKNFPMDRVDCHIATDSISYFLISTDVLNQWQLLLRGKVRIWGSKPWIALRLRMLFKSP